MPPSGPKPEVASSEISSTGASNSRAALVMRWRNVLPPSSSRDLSRPMRELRPPARMKMISGVLLRFGTPLLKGTGRAQSNKKEAVSLRGHGDGCKSARTNFHGCDDEKGAEDDARSLPNSVS